MGFRRFPRFVRQLNKSLEVALNRYSDGASQRQVLGRDPYLLKVVQGRSKKTSSPRERSNRRFGEDSWFLASTPKADVVGVADGVGGWRDMGVDAGRFAKELMACCCNEVERSGFDGRHPRELLAAGYRELTSRKDPVVGSSTACVVALHRRTCTLHTANLGDSGFLVLRNGKVLLRSMEQTHQFNTPYQLTIAPNHKHSSVYRDRPEMAEVSRLNLQPDDLVLVATDGLFDNMPEKMLLGMLKKGHGLREEQQLQEVAGQVVDKARELSLNDTFQSPFSMKAKANNFAYPRGGKPDDITIILARVEVP